MKLAATFVFGLLGGVAGALLVRALEPPARERAETAPRVSAAQMDSLAERVSALEKRPAAPEAPAPEPAASSQAAPKAPEGVGHGEGGGEDVPAAAAPAQEISDLVASLRGKKFGPEDTGRLFSWLTVHKERIKDAIAAIQKEIAADPTNPELQVALATAYVADLTNNTLPGPQQGMVWMKASAAYDAAIKLDPEHWTARYGKAFGSSQVPEFLGMRPQAIKQFEELLDLQRRKAPEPHYADTYFQLGTLYKDAGNVEKAREIWAEGLRLFPDSEELKGTIEASTKK